MSIRSKYTVAGFAVACMMAMPFAAGSARADVYHAPRTVYVKPAPRVVYERPRTIYVRSAPRVVYVEPAPVCEVECSYVYGRRICDRY